MNQPNRRAWREGELTPIGAIIERNIELATKDPIARGGFTQVPNFILKNSQLSVGAKVAYAMFLSYAWHNDFCFPGQDGLAKDMGITRPRVTQLIAELQAVGLITIQRRGQGKTNIYRIHSRVSRVGSKTSRG